MTRTHRTYADRTQHRRFEGLDVSRPTAGFYKMRLRSGGVFGAVKVWNGPPLDPVTGEELDRSWRWQALFDGAEIDIDRVWPNCGKTPVSEAEYTRLLTRAVWARKHAPDSAYADHSRKVDPLSLDTPLAF